MHPAFRADLPVEVKLDTGAALLSPQATTRARVKARFNATLGNTTSDQVE